jgi:hypothetical protein
MYLGFVDAQIQEASTIGLARAFPFSLSGLAARKFGNLAIFAAIPSCLVHGEDICDVSLGFCG